MRGDVSRLGSQVVLAALPLHPLYIVDIMIYPSQAASFLRSVPPPHVFLRVCITEDQKKLQDVYI